MVVFGSCRRDVSGAGGEVTQDSVECRSKTTGMRGFAALASERPARGNPREEQTLVACKRPESIREEGGMDGKYFGFPVARFGGWYVV